MNPNATPEDEAFAEMEQRIHNMVVERYMQRAQIEAARFIQDNQDLLGMMTLRKAFEMGYRLGYSDATDKTHQDA
jgi:DNA polymerase II large subunit